MRGDVLQQVAGLLRGVFFVETMGNGCSCASFPKCRLTYVFASVRMTRGLDKTRDGE